MQKTLAQRRIGEICKLIRHRHPHGVPATDDVLLYVEAIAPYFRTDPKFPGILLSWADLHLYPGALGIRDLENIVGAIGPWSKRITSDDAARALGVTFRERTECGLKSIGSIDVDQAGRKQARLEKKRARDAERIREKRSADGRVSRAEYLASSRTKLKPWVQMNVSRATWYRLGCPDPANESLRENETSPSPPYLYKLGDTLVSIAVPPGIGRLKLLEQAAARLRARPAIHEITASHHGSVT